MDEFEHECGICCSDVDETKNKNICIDCNSLICDKCINKKHYQSGDWLWLQTSCSKCEKYVCRECIIVCYECANIGDTYDVYCSNCAPDDIEYVNCEYHEWSLCKKHEKNRGCGTCKTNKNYYNKYVL